MPAGGHGSGRRGKPSVRALGIVCSQERKLKKLTELHHKEWIVRLKLTQRGEPYQARARRRRAAGGGQGWCMVVGNLWDDLGLKCRNG